MAGEELSRQVLVKNLPTPKKLGELVQIAVESADLRRVNPLSKRSGALPAYPLSLFKLCVSPALVAGVIACG